MNSEDCYRLCMLLWALYYTVEPCIMSYIFFHAVICLSIKESGVLETKTLLSLYPNPVKCLPLVFTPKAAS